MALVGRFPALAGVDLDVAHGEIVLLAGPNGAGKTSLLRLCAGLLPIARGSAVVLGHDLTSDRRTVRRRVGFVGHATALYDDLTVRDNVRFWARAAGATAADADAAMDRLAIPARLADVAVHRLSAGQRRRTSIAAVVARRPELWLLDEPHAGLDVDARDLLDELVREAVAGGATAIVASHELERARGLADRAVQVVGGQVLDSTAIEGGDADGSRSSRNAGGACHEPGVSGASTDDAVDVA
ncbi:MAG: heme ABC exporter ATP-binding protein CcmA [Actinomycetota bacterium]|nr:heme ABC exporter ATP-binding protein CcmA [Actinomycetota bacterium]